MCLRNLQGRVLEKERSVKQLVLYSWNQNFFFQKQVAKELPSKPVDILSEAAMRNAYYTCHNVQVCHNTLPQHTDMLRNLLFWVSFHHLGSVVLSRVSFFHLGSVVLSRVSFFHLGYVVLSRVSFFI